jgi:hypothetical protein
LIDPYILVRVGSQPPNDENLCNHYLDFLVLEKIVDSLKENSEPKYIDAWKLQESILNKSRIIVSTLNNCGSSQMKSLEKKIALVIIDEGKNEQK